MAVGLRAAGADACPARSAALERAREVEVAELVAAVARHPFEPPASRLQLRGDAPASFEVWATVGWPSGQATSSAQA